MAASDSLEMMPAIRVAFVRHHKETPLASSTDQLPAASPVNRQTSLHPCDNAVHVRAPPAASHDSFWTVAGDQTEALRRLVPGGPHLGPTRGETMPHAKAYLTLTAP